MLSELFLTNLSRSLIASMPEINPDKKPANRMCKGMAESRLKVETILKKLAPIMIGTESINEKRVAASLLSPINIAPEIVEPDLETPGSNAKL